MRAVDKDDTGFIHRSSPFQPRRYPILQTFNLNQKITPSPTGSATKYTYTPNPPISTTPHTDHAILPPFDHIPILYPYPLDYARIADDAIDPGAAIPLSAVGFIVHFDRGLAGCGDDAAGVEVHAGDGRVVGEGVVDGAGAEVPDLYRQRDSAAEVCNK